MTSCLLSRWGLSLGECISSSSCRTSSSWWLLSSTTLRRNGHSADSTSTLSTSMTRCHVKRHVFTRLITMEYNTYSCTTCARPTTGAESETRPVTRGEDGVVELRASTHKMCLNMLLERSQGRTAANFDRDFIIRSHACHAYAWRHNLMAQNRLFVNNSRKP